MGNKASHVELPGSSGEWGGGKEGAVEILHVKCQACVDSKTSFPHLTWYPSLASDHGQGRRSTGDSSEFNVGTFAGMLFITNRFLTSRQQMLLLRPLLLYLQNLLLRNNRNWCWDSECYNTWFVLFRHSSELLNSAEGIYPS